MVHESHLQGLLAELSIVVGRQAFFPIAPREPTTPILMFFLSVKSTISNISQSACHNYICLLQLNQHAVHYSTLSCTVLIQPKIHCFRLIIRLSMTTCTPSCRLPPVYILIRDHTLTGFGERWRAPILHQIFKFARAWETEASMCSSSFCTLCHLRQLSWRSRTMLSSWAIGDFAIIAESDWESVEIRRKRFWGLRYRPASKMALSLLWQTCQWLAWGKVSLLYWLQLFHSITIGLWDSTEWKIILRIS